MGVCAFFLSFSFLFMDPPGGLLRGTRKKGEITEAVAGIEFVVGDEWD